MIAARPPVSRLSWQMAVMSKLGPANPITRIVLMALQTFMDSDGGRCYPSQPRIAERAGVSLRTAKEHLELAYADGWVQRWYRKPGSPRGGYAYRATLPDSVLWALERERTEKMARSGHPPRDPHPPPDQREQVELMDLDAGAEKTAPASLIGAAPAPIEPRKPSASEEKLVIGAAAAPIAPPYGAAPARSDPLIGAAPAPSLVQLLHPNSSVELYPLAAAVVLSTLSDGGDGCDRDCRRIRTHMTAHALPPSDALAVFQRLPAQLREQVLQMAQALLPAAPPPDPAQAELALAGAADRAALQAEMRRDVDEAAAALEPTPAARLRAAARMLITGDDATAWTIPRGDHSERVPWPDRPRLLRLGLGIHAAGERDTLRRGLQLAVQQQLAAFRQREAGPAPGTEAAAVHQAGRRAETPGAGRREAGGRPPDTHAAAARTTVRIAEWMAAHPEEHERLQAEIAREVAADPEWANHPALPVERGRRLRERILAELEPAAVGTHG